MRRITLVGWLMVCGALLLAPRSLQAQLPPRQPIFLNNNASLYTFPNPNFGLPSQLPFAFVAVAHEDCRLFNNGAMLMPQHRLMAAECQMNGQNGGVTPPIIPPILPILCPCTGTLETPATCAILCGGFPGPFPGQGFGGYNRMRQPYYPPMYAYGGGYVPQGGNYASYNPGLPCCGGNTASLSTASQGQAQPQQWYKGFGTYTESSFKGFQATVGNNAQASFGDGFDKESSVQSGEQEEEKK